MKRPHVPLFKIFCAESGSKIAPKVKKVANTFTVEMDAEKKETCSFIYRKYRLTLANFWKILNPYLGPS